MSKVQLPKVDEKTRTELNVIKARRNDKTLNETLEYLISLDKENQRDYEKLIKAYGGELIAIGGNRQEDHESKQLIDMKELEEKINQNETIHEHGELIKRYVHEKIQEYKEQEEK